MEGSDRQWTLQQLHSVDKEGETAVGILDHIAVWAHLTQEKKPRASNRYWKATVSWQRPPLPVRQSQTGGACPGQISGPRRLQRVQNAALTLTLTLALVLTLALALALALTPDLTLVLTLTLTLSLTLTLTLRL